MIRLCFNEFDEQYLEQNAHKMTVNELANSMCRSYSAIYAKLKKMAIQPKKKYKNHSKK
jgi:hypothetical protein